MISLVQCAQQSECQCTFGQSYDWSQNNLKYKFFLIQLYYLLADSFYMLSHTYNMLFLVRNNKNVEKMKGI